MQIQIIDQTKFATAVLALEKEASIIYKAYIKSKMIIYPVCKAQIALFSTKKVSVPKKYINFSNVFSKKSAAILTNCSNINKHAIDLKPSK